MDDSAQITLAKVFAALPQADGGKPVRLSGDPHGKNIVYCNGRNVYIRSLKDPSQVDIFTGHTKPATVARYSPSRLYIASADVSGKVLVWDAEKSDHPLRAQHQALKGLVKDLDWSPDSLWLTVCGNSDTRYSCVIGVDDGDPLGVIEGHNKLVNTCSYKQRRPFTIVTASEDNNVAFHRGTPFRLQSVYKLHNHYVLVARHSHNGEIVISGGADGKLFKYEEKTAEKPEVQEIGSPAHQGPVYDLCFSPSDKQVLTVSGDRTAKVFDVLSGKLLLDLESNSNQCWKEQVQGCLWQGDVMVTVNTRGHMLHYSMDPPGIPHTAIKGHMKPITGLALSKDGTRIFTGNQEGIMCWDSETGVSEEISVTGQLGDLVDMAVDDDHLVCVCGDCRVHFVPVPDREQESFAESDQLSVHQGPLSLMPVMLRSKPNAVDARQGKVVVACVKHVTVMGGASGLCTIQVRSPATCVSIHPGACSVATGHEDRRVRVYWLSRGVLQTRVKVEMHAPISAVSYAMCGAYLAVGAEQRVSALSATDYRELFKREVHKGHVTCVAWSPDGDRFVTAGKEGMVVLWDDVNDSYKNRPRILAHAGSYANRIGWLDNTTVVTAGYDSNIKHFTMPPNTNASQLSMSQNTTRRTSNQSMPSMKSSSQTLPHLTASQQTPFHITSSRITIKIPSTSHHLL